MDETMQHKPEKFHPRLKFRNYSSPVNRVILEAARTALPIAIKVKIKEVGNTLFRLSACRCKEDTCPDSNHLNALVHTINYLKRQFNKSIGHRAYAALDLYIHVILINILRKNPDDIDITYPCLEALKSISKDIPEILDAETMFLILFQLDYQFIAATKQQLLKWIYVLTVNDEENRQFAYEQVLQQLLEILYDETTTSPVIEDVALVIRALVSYDEDPRTLRKAYNRIKTIGVNVMNPLVHLLHKFLYSVAVLKIILVTLQKILIENELTEELIQVNKGRGLIYIINVYDYQFTQQDLVLEVLKIFHIMVDCENVLNFMDKELLIIIKAALRYYPTSVPITETTLELIAKVLLKYPYCSKWYYRYYITELVVRAMELHPLSYTVQKKASWIMRIFIKDCNVAPLFERLRVPSLLMKAAEIHKGRVLYDVMGALREMGHKMDMTEPIKERMQRTDVAI